MKILVLDSAMNGCSAAIYESGSGIIATQVSMVTRGQAECLIPMAGNVLCRAGYAYSDLDMIAVTRGPGAFTGMRIGIAAAKSLGLSLGIPVIGVCTLRAIFQTYIGTNIGGAANSQSPYIGVILETKRSDYYVQIFDANTRKAYSNKSADNISAIISNIEGMNIILVGDAVDRFEGECAPYHCIGTYSILLPDVGVIAAIAKDAYKEGKHFYSDLCTPVYLRPPDVSLSPRPSRKLV